MLHVALLFWIVALSCHAASSEQDTIWPEDKRLEFLRRYYSANQSNHFVDLWESQTLRSIILSAGLADTHTLFVNSHGKGIKTKNGKRYVFYPHETLTDEATPLFHIEDFARLLGPTNVLRIHNIVLAACNVEGALDLNAIRASFPNATNIIHSAAGQEGYQPMLFQMLLSASSRIEALYEFPVKSRSGETEYEISSRPRQGAKKLSPYVAALFAPGATRPFRTQVAGRELLVSTREASIAALP